MKANFFNDLSIKYLKQQNTIFVKIFDTISTGAATWSVETTSSIVRLLQFRLFVFKIVESLQCIFHANCSEMLRHFLYFAARFLRCVWPFCDNTNERLIPFYLFHDGGRYHVETSPLICSGNQWTGFYMITASVMKELNKIWFWWKPWFDYDVVTRYDIPINICVLTGENNYIVNFADNESLLSSNK